MQQRSHDLNSINNLENIQIGTFEFEDSNTQNLHNLNKINRTLAQNSDVAVQ